MTIHRHAAKRDGNEVDVVAALEQVGCTVERISGAGVPDLLVWSPWLACLVLVEVKTPAKAKRKNTPHQEAFRARWASTGAPIHRVSTAGQALFACGFSM